MSIAPDLRGIFDPPEEIIQAGLNGELVLFVGVGAFMILKLPSWSQLANDAFIELRNNPRKISCSRFLAQALDSTALPKMPA